MNYKILIGSVLGASLLVAGTAFARDGGSEENARDTLKVNLEGKVALEQKGVKGEERTDTEVKDQQSEDQQKEEDKPSLSEHNGTASGTVARGEEERGRERKQEEENRNRSASSSVREHEEDNASASSTEDEHDNATSTAAERQREEHISKVEEAVKELLDVADHDEGIGEEVRSIAQAQKHNQEKINESLKKAEERNAFAKFFFGADQAAIDQAKQLVAANEAQIKQLADLKARMATGTDQTVIDTQIKLLEKVNAEASSSVSTSEGGFSVFGWMFRLFGR